MNLIEQFLAEGTVLDNHHSEANKIIKPHSDERKDLSRQSTHHYVSPENVDHVKNNLSNSGYTHHTNYAVDGEKSSHFVKGHTHVMISDSKDRTNGKHSVNVMTHAGVKNLKFDKDHPEDTRH